MFSLPDNNPVVDGGATVTTAGFPTATDPASAAVVAAATAAVNVTVSDGGEVPVPVPVQVQQVQQEQVEENRDIVRDYLVEVRRGAPHDARRYHEACEIAFTRKPNSLQQSTDALELARLSNAQCKVMLSVMNVTGCKNSCLAAKKYILACKMVQRQVALQALFDITSRLGLVPAHEQRADGGTLDAEVARIKSLPKTSAAAEPPRPGQLVTEIVNWARGDVPVFIDNDVVIGEPPISQTVGALEEEALVKQENEVKRRVGRPRVKDEERPLRRRRVTIAGEHVGSIDNEIFIKEAEAQSAGARAVQDTLKAIRDTEEVMNACSEEDMEGRTFYKSVIDILRTKMGSIIGLKE